MPEVAVLEASDHSFNIRNAGAHKTTRNNVQWPPLDPQNFLTPSFNPPSHPTCIPKVLDTIHPQPSQCRKIVLEWECHDVQPGNHPYWQESVKSMRKGNRLFQNPPWSHTHWLWTPPPRLRMAYAKLRTPSSLPHRTCTCTMKWTTPRPSPDPVGSKLPSYAIPYHPIN